MPARLLVLQHSATAPLGVMAERFALRGTSVETLQATAGCALPADAATVDGLVLLGGEMNAYDDALCPHFPALMDVVAERTAAGRPVLGICLGAQLVTRALGARVVLNGAPEFGFVDLDPMPAVESDPVIRDAWGGLAVMQHHDDACTLPEGATLLLTCGRQRVQAFRAGLSTYAFQCHLEMDEATAKVWGQQRGRAKNNQAIPIRLSAEMLRHHPRAARFGRAVADAWLDLVESRATR